MTLEEDYFEESSQQLATVAVFAAPLEHLAVLASLAAVLVILAGSPLAAFVLHLVILDFLPVIIDAQLEPLVELAVIVDWPEDQQFPVVYPDSP